MPVPTPVTVVVGAASLIWGLYTDYQQDRDIEKLKRLIAQEKLEHQKILEACHDLILEQIVKNELEALQGKIGALQRLLGFVADQTQDGIWAIATLASIIALGTEGTYQAEDILNDTSEAPNRTWPELAPCVVGDFALAINLLALVAAATTRLKDLNAGEIDAPAIWIREQVQNLGQSGLNVLKRFSDSRFGQVKIQSGEAGEGTPMFEYGYLFDGHFKMVERSPHRNNPIILERVKDQERRDKEDAYPRFVGVQETTDLLQQLQA